MSIACKRHAILCVRTLMTRHCIIANIVMSLYRFALSIGKTNSEICSAQTSVQNTIGELNIVFKLKKSEIPLALDGGMNV